MKTQSQRVLPVILFCLVLAAAATSLGAAGVVIEEIGPGSALEKAGIRPGDLLSAWERERERGEIHTVFDWLWVKAEQAPRAGMRLRGERDGVAVSFEIPRGFEWDARARPWMAADLLETYSLGQRRVEAGDVEGGVSLWSELAQRAGPDLKCWLLLEISEAWSKSGQGVKARSALQAALADEQDAQTRIVLWEELGENHQLANEMTQAESGFRSALEVGESAWGESLRVAGTMAKLGNVLRLQNRLDLAGQLEERALEIRQRRAPDSLEVVDSLHHLSLVAWNRKDLEAMAELTRRALALQARWPPDTLAMADTLSDLALLAFERGHYAEAAATYQRSLAILERRSPESITRATVLGRAGLTVQFLGDFETAEGVLQQALAIREKLAPESLGTAFVLNSLATVARERGDFDEAAELIRRALAIWSKAAPEGHGVAEGLDALGLVARMRGDLDQAWSLHSRALEIRKKLPHRTNYIAFTLDLLGRVAEERGDLTLALDLYRQAHEIYERQLPGSILEAELLHEMGQIHRRLRRLVDAEKSLGRAVDVLESQVERLGDSQEFRATFRARHEEIYHDAIETELELGHAAEAFHLVERSRARSFLALLNERDLTFPGEIPEALERSLQDNASRHDQTLLALAALSPAAGEGAGEDLHQELGRLRRERDEIAAEIRKASPRLAALRQPQPLDLDAARKALDPGTLALSYSVGEKETALFAVTREGGLQVKTLPVGEKQLRQDVERFVDHVRQLGADGETAALAHSLYRTLLAPVAGLVEKSERVLILPDGPLHRLPFGALVRTTNGRDQYLTEWKPLHTALSLTGYGMLRASEKALSASPGAIIAFGDPHYPKALAATGETRNPPLRNRWDLRSFDWTPLPYSRREVERIATAYPGARLYLGDGATEDQAKAVAHEARVLHFATHGYLDDRVPLDSALVLTIPAEPSQGKDNGLLQVWEIFESVRLDADLVVLSGCDTALGRELSGEGMIGLTRAFQYAGARSVVASLWSVTDQLTAELMARFHRHYAAGLSKDEALRQAQIEMIRRPVQVTTASGQTMEVDASAPFFWAAFQVFGDWR